MKKLWNFKRVTIQAHTFVNACYRQDAKTQTCLTAVREMEKTIERWNESTMVRLYDMKKIRAQKN